MKQLFRSNTLLIITSIFLILSLLLINLGVIFTPTSAAESGKHYQYSGVTVNSKDSQNWEISYDGSGAKISIGDGTSKFSPKTLFSAFDGEVQFSLNLNGFNSVTDTSLKGSEVDAVIIAQNADYRFTYNPVPPKEGFNDLGGFDYSIEFTSQPKVVPEYLSFTLGDKVGLTPYFQPSLREEYQDGWSEEFQDDITVTDTDIYNSKGESVVHRPDYVVNSIAFYADGKSGDYTALGGKDYKAGKVGHLYRMKASDAEGKSEWLDWQLSSDTEIRLVDSTGFLQTATFPVTIAPVGDTFGYTTVASTAVSYTQQYYSQRSGTGYTSPNGTGISMSIYARKISDNNVKMAISTNSDSNDYLVTNAKTNSVLVNNSTPQWWTANFTTSPTFSSGSTYYCWFMQDAGSSSTHFYRDTGGSEYQRTRIQSSFDFPSNWYCSTGSVYRFYSIYCTYTPIIPPTITISPATSIEDTTATLNGNITATGGDNPTVTLYWGTTDGGQTPGNWDYSSAPTSPSQPQGVASFYLDVTSLSPGTTVYFSAKATNTAGDAWPAASLSFLTKPAAPTNVSATDGSDTGKVTITWTKSVGASGYVVYRDNVNVSSTLGDVDTYDDTGADAPTITTGTVAASDGTYTSCIELSVTSASANNGTNHTYKVVASNATGDSVASATDTGYRGVGSLTYQWQRSTDDSDADYSDISGGTTNPYEDEDAPADGSGRYYKVILSAAGAIQQTSTADRGYRAISPPSITNTPSSYGFGLIIANNTYSTGLDYFTITNNTGGGSAVDITIHGTDIMATSYTWTLSDTATPGTDICGFLAGLENGSYNVMVKKTAPYNVLISDLADGASQSWGLQFLTPAEITDYESDDMYGTITLTVSLH